MSQTAQSMMLVSTLLTPSERLRVDAAGEGSYRAIHRDGMGELMGDIKTKRAEAVLVSVARCDGPFQASISTLVREFPRVSTVALVTAASVDVPRVALSLGSSGVTQLVDVREPRGWNDLRRVLLSSRATDIQRDALAQLSLDLAGADPQCQRFFETLFASPATLTTVRGLCDAMGLLPSTLMSRFYRAGLPAPKRYLATARLVRAARLFENPGFSVANVANHLDYSSPQSFGRHVRTLLGMTAGQFRDRFDGPGMLRHFRETLVLPHLTALRTLRPLGGPVSGDSATGARYH